jgi:uncharacterized protein with PIN domain
MMGYDTVIADSSLHDCEVLGIARDQGRILLTRDKSFMRNSLAYYVRSRDLGEQLTDIVGHFGLEVSFPEKTLCPVCGEALRKASREELGSKVPDRVRSDTYWQCLGCGKAYWKGGHWEKIRGRLQTVRKSA